MGSGHILVYAFDVLMQIYESQGIRARDAVQRILKYNLYGLDIDDRAAQLAYFSIMMKARQYDRRILIKGDQPHVYAIQESDGISQEDIDFFSNGDAMLKHDMIILIKEMRNAKEFGSIISISDLNWHKIEQRLYELENELDPYAYDTAIRIKGIINSGKLLSKSYRSIITNPPYLSNGDMNSSLQRFAKYNFKK